MRHKITIHNQNYIGYIAGYISCDAVISPATYSKIPNIWERWIGKKVKVVVDGYAVVMPEKTFERYMMGDSYWKLIKFFETKEEAIAMRNEIND